MRHKHYLLSVFDKLSDEEKKQVEAIRMRYELEANKRKLRMVGSILSRVLKPEEQKEFEELYQAAYIKIYGQEQLTAARAYFAGSLNARDFIKAVKLNAPRSSEKIIDFADQVAGRIMRTVKPE